MTPNAMRQSAYRARQRLAFNRRGDALQAIIAKLDGNTKPLAVELRQIAQEALS